MSNETIEAPQEPSPAQKMQQEYNQLCGMRGHTHAQIMMLTEECQKLDEKIKKLVKKSANLPQEKTTPADNAAPSAAEGVTIGLSE